MLRHPLREEVDRLLAAGFTAILIKGAAFWSWGRHGQLYTAEAALEMIAQEGGRCEESQTASTH